MHTIVRQIRSIFPNNAGKFIQREIINCLMLRDTAENSRSVINEDLIAQFAKQEKDLLGV